MHSIYRKRKTVKRKKEAVVKKAFPPLARVFPVLELCGDGHKHMRAGAEN